MKLTRLLDRSRRRPARTALGVTVTLVATLVWSHGLAGVLRAPVGGSMEALAAAANALTFGAIAAALAACTALRSPLCATTRAGLAGLVAWNLATSSHPDAAGPLAALFIAPMAGAWTGSFLARRLPGSLDLLARERPRAAMLWTLIALLSVVQVGRLATHVTNPESDWFLSTRDPFFAKHECLNAYLFGAELAERGESNLYDAAHYPGLNAAAEPHTEIAHMSPEDPFQYPPPFLLLPLAGLQFSQDYGVLRAGWFALNVTLCLAVCLALAVWVGGATGRTAALALPALLLAFPVLHNFQYGQFHFAAIALAVLGLILIEQRRSAPGGWLIALAILAKLFPAVLLVPLAVRRRTAALTHVALALMVFTLAGWAALGTEPFHAFLTYQLPRLGDGRAFAFDAAWPELAPLVTAGNQGVFGMLQKLAAMGVPAAGAAAPVLARLFTLSVLVLAFLLARRGEPRTRAARAQQWLALLGLASLASTGAWADYVPLTGVWLLTYLLPWAARGSVLRRSAFGAVALLQITLLGTMPIGSAADPSWMLPLSLCSALALLATFALTAWRTSLPAAESVRTACDASGLRLVEASDAR